MKLKQVLTALAMGAAIIATPAAAQSRISIGTGGTGGLFYVIGAGMAEIINKNMDGTTARAEVTGASIENIRRVSADQMTFGFSSSSTLYEAKNGEGAFDGEAQPVAAMAYLYPAVLQLATTADTGVTSIADLKGKRVSLGPPGSNSAVLAQRLLEAYGVFGSIEPEFLSYTEGAQALMNGTVDAAAMLAGAPTAALIDLDAQSDMVMLSLDRDKVKGMLDKYPFYQVYDIPAGTYPDQKEKVTVINDPATLFTKEDADEDLVYGITKTLFTHLEALGQIHPQAKAVSLDTATNTPIDLHPGAKRYFDEAE